MSAPTADEALPLLLARSSDRPAQLRAVAVLLHDAADHDVNVRPVPVTAPAAMAPVNVSVMTIMARHLHRGTHCTSKPSAAPLRTGLLAEPAAPVFALPSLPLTPFVPACLSTSASPVRAWLVTGFRTSPSCSVCASARAFWRVLRTTALNSVCTPRHSVAVAAPFCELRPRRFPFAHTPGSSFMTACRGFGSHTPHSRL